MTTDDHNAEEYRMRHLKDISLTDLYHNLQRQGDSVSDIKKQLEPLAKLATSVELLAQRMTSVQDELASFDAVRTRVTIHQTIHWILGAICGLVFPVLVSWNFQLNADLRSMQSQLDGAKEKIHALERVTYTKQP
jgi:hypothetical protein